jgi:beta-mannosidase
MFANMAPGDMAFTANVEAEVREQVARWGDHPCLALVNGNNELDVAWANWGWQEKYTLHGADSARVWNDHVALFQHRIPAALKDLCVVPYVHTSPLSNWGSAAGLRSGDLHYWGVWHGDSAFTAFANNVGRFVSEYGFQSYPDSAVLAQYIRPEDLFLGSPALAYRQRSYKGDAPIRAAIERAQGGLPATLDGFCRASQAVQAEGYRLAEEAHLAARPRCMGTLFWQLNDPWPGPSWSLIDHDGHWKPGLFAVQEVFAKP